MKQFTTAVAEAEESEVDEGMPFEIDGVKCVCYRPGDGQLALFMAATGRHSSTESRVAGAINFFASVLDDSSYAHVEQRLMDRKDPFGLPQVEGIMAWMIEEWSARPTQRPSGSTSSPPNTGSNSKSTTLQSI